MTRAYPPAWVYYGGDAWMPSIQRTVDIPTRVWPVVDVQDDNLGQGLIVSILGTVYPGLDVVIDALDLEAFRGASGLCWCGKAVTIWRDLDPGDAEVGPRPDLIGFCSKGHMDYLGTVEEDDSRPDLDDMFQLVEDDDA